MNNKVIYKMNVIDVSKIQDISIGEIIKFETFKCNSVFYDNYNNLTSLQQIELEREIRHLPYSAFLSIKKENIHAILKKIIDGKDVYNYETTILCEKIIDENNQVYAKEINTGLIFPIVSEETVDYKFSLTDEIACGVYLIMLKIAHNFKYKSLAKVGCALFEIGIANQNDIDDYCNYINKGIMKKVRKKKFEENVLYYYKQNAFKEEVTIKSQEIVNRQRLNQNEITKCMEQIEYMLIKLQKCNEDLYKKYNQIYEDLLKSEEKVLSLDKLNVLSLSKLLANIEIDYLVNYEKSDSILDYLNTLSKEYLFNFLTNKEQKTKLTIKELEYINELFLKVKNRYSVIEQRKILQKFGLLYLLELKENIDIININDLENSYINDHLTNIMINIELLREMGFIKDNILIDLNNTFNLKDIIEIIKQLEFDVLNEEESKECVKKI